MKNDYSEIKGFTVRNMQYMVQFFNEYNQELTMVKGAVPSITQSAIAHSDKKSTPITKSVISQLVQAETSGLTTIWGENAVSRKIYQKNKTVFMLADRR